MTDGECKEVSDKVSGLRLGKKLMLVAGLPGVESSSIFVSLYLVPVLQTLGMPLRLASMTGFISGPLGIVLVPLLGWLSDRGSNPIRRKMVVLLVSTMITTCGLTLVAVICTVYIHPSHTETDWPNNMSLSTNMTTSSVIDYVKYPHDVTVPATVATRLPAGAGTAASAKDSQIPSGNNTDSSPYNATTSTSGDQHMTGDMLGAGLAMFGFILFECGYDQTVTSVRSWVVACSPRGEHTSLLVLAIMVAAVGGMSNAALGRVNFPAMFRLDSRHGTHHAALLIQAGVQAVITVLIIVVGMTFTLLTGHRMSWKHGSTATPTVQQDTAADSCDQHSALLVDKDKNVSRGNGEDRDLKDDYTKDGHTSVHVHSDAHPAHDGHDSVHKLLTQGSHSLSEERVVIHESNCHSETEDTVCGHNTEGDVDRRVDGAVLADRERAGCFCGCCQSYYGNLAPICVGMYFTCGGMYCYSFMVSDYVGKAVYGGDPHADAGSESVGLYTAGVRTAAWGFLTYSSVYMLINLLHTRILTLLGYKLEFVLVQLLTGGSMVLLALTARLELFFLLSVAVGLYRAALYVVPFAAANDVVQKMMKHCETSGSRPRVGLAMSVVGSMIPLSFTTVFPWMGPLTEYTGVHATPLWVGALFTCLAAAGFMLVKTDVGPKCPVKR